MSKTYFNIDFKKVKTAEQYKNWNAHNRRDESHTSSNVDSSQSHKNICFIDMKETYTQYRSRIKQKIRLFNNKNKTRHRDLRKDKDGHSTSAFNIVVSMSNGCMNEAEAINYLTDAHKWFKKRFKGHQCLNSHIHLEETTEHLHIQFSYFNDEKGKWNQKGMYQDGISDLDNINNLFEKEVASKYGLKRGDLQTKPEPSLSPNQAEALKEKIQQEELKRLRDLLDTTKQELVVPTITKHQIERKVGTTLLGTAKLKTSNVYSSKEVTVLMDHIYQLHDEIQKKDLRIHNLSTVHNEAIRILEREDNFINMNRKMTAKHNHLLLQVEQKTKRINYMKKESKQIEDLYQHRKSLLAQIKQDVHPLLFINEPYKKTQNGFIMKSPLRPDNNPSFYVFKDKSSQNWVYKDFSSQEMGDNLDLYMQVNSTDFNTALEDLSKYINQSPTLQESEITISTGTDKLLKNMNDVQIVAGNMIKLSNIYFDPLKKMLNDRKILKVPNWLKQIRNLVHNSFNLCIETIKKSFSLRGNGSFKGFLGTGAISHINNNKSETAIVEGMFDALSLYQEHENQLNYIILNSVANWKDIKQLNLDNQEIIIYLDNDDAGHETADLISQYCGDQYLDHHVIFPIKKDINEDLIKGHNVNIDQKIALPSTGDNEPDITI
jgi:5S rRNA maturation endonuclease (ribonuclease M5)